MMRLTQENQIVNALRTAFGGWQIRVEAIEGADIPPRHWRVSGFSLVVALATAVFGALQCAVGTSPAAEPVVAAEKAEAKPAEREAKPARDGNAGPTTGSLRAGVAIEAPIAIESERTNHPAGHPAAAFPPPSREPADLKPKHEDAQSLFRKWQARARTDGKIPGALIGHVAMEVDNFLKQSPAGEMSAKLAALRPRLDSSHDWTQAEAIALLDDITDISTAPVSWADLSNEFAEMRVLHPGEPLPTELTSAAWGTPLANGLRAAWLLEPHAEQYAIGSVLKTRVLFHNSGKTPVVFMTETWHQDDRHSARDAKGTQITVSGTWYSGVTPTATYRLAPGQYCEVSGHGLAIGTGTYEEEFSTGVVGAIIAAKPGDDVTLSHRVDAAQGGWMKPDDPKDPAELWKKVIAERVANEAPMPQTAADREQLIRRVTLDLFGEAATTQEVAAFTADNAPDALAKLTARLQQRPRIKPWAGTLLTGETKFRVTAADPNSAKAPRSTNGPGCYVLGERARLLVSQRTADRQRTNKAIIAFLPPDPKVASPHKPYEIALPDGLASYGIAWERGAGVLWILQKDLARKYDFTNPAKVKETRIEPGSIINLPAYLRDAMRKAFDMHGAPLPRQNSRTSKDTAGRETRTEAVFKVPPAASVAGKMVAKGNGADELPAAANKPEAKPAEKEAKPVKDGNAASKTSSLRVRVVDEADKPLAGAKLKAAFLGHNADYTTDAEGRATVVVPGPNRLFLSLIAEPEGYPPVRKWWRNDSGNELIPDEFTFTFERGRTIGGIVRDEQGRAIPGAKVHLSISATKYEQANMCLALWENDFATDAQGRWQLDHAPQQIDSIAVGLQHQDYISDDCVAEISAAQQRQVGDRTAVMS